MSLASYSDLQSAVANWTHRADLTSVIPDLITLAETKILRDLRTREMETAFSSTMAADGTLAIWSNYIDLKEAYISASPIRFLERKNARFIREKYALASVVSTPRFIAREGTNFIFGPYPDSQYTVNGIFYKNRGPLSTNTTHAIFTNNPDVYLFGTLLETVPYLKDEKRVPIWEQKYQSALEHANRKSVREEFSGSDLRMVSA